MNLHRTTLLMTFIALLWLVPATSAGDGIAIANSPDGRKIFINNSDNPHSLDVSSGSRSAAYGTTRYIYWSNTEHRWKPVPGQSATAVRARSAAAEVLAETEASAPTAEGDKKPAEAATATSVTPEKVNIAIEQAAARHNVDPDLVRAVIKVESNFNPHAVSHKGAMGLMQLMPGTARSLNLAHPFDPTENVDAGVRHLKHLLENFGGDVRLSLAAYNAGEKAVQRHNGVPPYAETQSYVRQITALYKNGVGMNGERHIPIQVSHDVEGHLYFSNTQ